MNCDCPPVKHENLDRKNMNEDDGIQRVVSQVRKFENESGEGTNQNLKFEIERTDSLEFTRNSASDS